MFVFPYILLERLISVVNSSYGNNNINISNNNKNMLKNNDSNDDGDDGNW